MGNNYIDIKTTNPALKGKIKQDISSYTDTVYWLIRFNIPLNPVSVNNDTMCVMDVKGKMLATHISYDMESNVIIITPLMPYKPNEPYVLTVFMEVRSRNNQRLKEDIQVVFKLKEAQISDYIVLKGDKLINVDVIERQRRDVKKRQKLGMSEESMRANDRLLPAPISVNFVIGAIGILSLVVSIFFSVLIGIILSIILLLGGIAHIFIQLTDTRSKSLRLYNDGVKLYNTENYSSSLYRFENALVLDPENEYARYAITRANSHLR